MTVTLLTAVLPTIATELDASRTTIAWVVTGPMLLTGVLQPAFGKAGDLYGHKRVYLAAWVAYTVCALGAALAPNVVALIVFRLAGAAAGAATAPTSMAIVLHAFAPKDRVKAMGWHSFVSAGAPVIGLVAGGPLVDLVGWRWVFGVQVPFAIPALALVWLVVRPDGPGRSEPFDLRGSLLFGLSVGALLFALNARSLVALCLSVLLFAAFVLAERRHPSPVVPFPYFRLRNVSFPIAALALSSVPYMGAFFISPFQMHDVLGYDNSRTASALVFRPLTYSLASALAGYVAVRIGDRLAAAAGLGVMTAGMVTMALIGGGSTFTHVALGMSLTGFGQGLANAPLGASVANAVQPEDFGSMSAVQQMARTVGMVGGMQGIQTFQSATGFPQAYAAAAGVSALSMLASLGIKARARASAL